MKFNHLCTFALPVWPMFYKKKNQQLSYEGNEQETEPCQASFEIIRNCKYICMYTEYIMKTWNTIYTHLMISRHLQIIFFFIHCLLPVCRTLLPSIPTGVTRVPRTDTFVVLIKIKQLTVKENTKELMQRLGDKNNIVPGWTLVVSCSGSKGETRCPKNQRKVNITEPCSSVQTINSIDYRMFS